MNHHKDAINRRQDKRLIIVLTAIHRVSCLNRTVLPSPQKSLQDIAAAIANKIAKLTKEIKIKAS
ncbi:MAG: hypothetical protein V7L11_27505 [Nostoc sp.]|uniref:hypothetical protein n=1 Tax=Nostoc sp. TaxID=1180 RepID=UPI002FF82BAE